MAQHEQPEPANRAPRERVAALLHRAPGWSVGNPGRAPGVPVRYWGVAPDEMAVRTALAFLDRIADIAHLVPFGTSSDEVSGNVLLSWRFGEEYPRQHHLWVAAGYVSFCNFPHPHFLHPFARDLDLDRAERLVRHTFWSEADGPCPYPNLEAEVAAQVAAHEARTLEALAVKPGWGDHHWVRVGGGPEESYGYCTNCGALTVGYVPVATNVVYLTAWRLQGRICYAVPGQPPRWYRHGDVPHCTARPEGE